MMKLKELAEKIGAVLSGPGDAEITAVAGLREAMPGEITFAADAGHLRDLDHSRASAAIVPLEAPDRNMPLLRMKNPRLGFARALVCLYGKPAAPIGISDKAVIGLGAVIGADPSIHPYAVVAENARIGDRVTLYPGVYVGRGSVLGNDTIVHPNVSIGHGVTIGSGVIIHAGTEIGSDGFGFVTDGGRHHKIPQVGGVVIEDDVEIGGNCSIDRATLGNTLIKRGTKLDNQVHVAHNVTIGEHCLIAGQVGIAGSSTLGNYVAFGGQVGVGDHRIIGDRVMAGGKAVITKDLEAGQVVAGNYAMPLKEWLKVQAVLPKLPELKKLVAQLERRLKEIENKEKI
jgi:UDP-3-O-[3-hydroxymyristoyl] glucosamine N-acyltransferase